MFQRAQADFDQHGLSGPSAFLRPASAKYLEELHRQYGTLKNAPNRRDVNADARALRAQQNKIDAQMNAMRRDLDAVRAQRDQYERALRNIYDSQFLVPNQDVGGGGDGDGGDGDRGARGSVVPPVQAEAGDGRMLIQSPSPRLL